MKLGPYKIVEGLRRDNPAFPVYLIYKGDRLVGRQFSRPCLSDCQWLERGGMYSGDSAALSTTPRINYRRGATSPAALDRRLKRAA
jgi:hypothetical protein